MSSTPERLERLLTEERGTCCAGDVEDRLRTITELTEDLSSDIYADVPALTALANDTRYTIAGMLVAAGRELCVCEITPVLDVSDSAISHALSTLHDAGLVERRKKGTWRYYRATDRATALFAALETTRDGGR